MNLINRNVFLIFILNISFFYCSEKLFPRNIEVNDFLEIEDQMIKKMKNFILRDRERLDVLGKHVQEWKEWRESYLSKESDYIAVLTNLIHLFKKFIVDFPKLEDIMKNNCYNDTMANDGITRPTNDDFKAFALSLIDFQYMHDLKPADIMHGKFKGFTANKTLPEEACFLIGETCLEYNEHSCAVDWLNLCRELTSDEEKRKKIFKQLYTSYLFLNDKENAYKCASSYLSYDHLDVSSYHVRLELGFELKQSSFRESNVIEARALCNGFYDDIIARRNFKCRYNFENSPFLKIAPLKEEVIFDDPKILVYREMLYDSEIEAIKSWSVKEMKSATVYGKNEKEKLSAFIYRISQTAFLDNKLPFVSNLHDRILDISQLSLNSGELMQIINYSPGGFYVTHSDYIPYNVDGIDTIGNRMTTLLFYMNDVPLGGETVFPAIKVSMKPVKGSVLLWYNVLPDESEDVRLYHSACPVLVGEKWAFTQWIRSKNQKCLRSMYEKYEKKSFKDAENEVEISYQKPRNFGSFVQDEFGALLRDVL